MASYGVEGLGYSQDHSGSAMVSLTALRLERAPRLVLYFFYKADICTHECPNRSSILDGVVPSGERGQVGGNRNAERASIDLLNSSELCDSQSRVKALLTVGTQRPAWVFEGRLSDGVVLLVAGTIQSASRR